MSELTRNTSFKIKAGSVASTLNLVPEAGAIVFDESLNALVVGDGFNFLPLGAGAPSKSAVALNLVTPEVMVMTAAVPVHPITIYDTVVYQIGTDIVPSLGSTITAGAIMNADFRAQYDIKSSIKDVTLTVEVVLNGITVQTIIRFMAKADLDYHVDSIGAVVFASGDVLTMKYTVDKNTTITVSNYHTGIHEI